MPSRITVAVCVPMTGVGGTTRTDQHGPREQLTAKFCPGDVEIDNIFSLFCKHFGLIPLPICLGDTQNRTLITPALTIA